MNLEEARNEIDSLDSQLIDLFSRRMNAVKEIAEIKKAQGMTVFSFDREKQIIERVMNSVDPENAHYAAAFFNYLMEISKTKQRECIAEPNEFTNKIGKILSESKTIESPRVYVQGVKGSYSTSAAKMMYPDGNITYVDRFEDVLCALSENVADYGILPVENSAAGSVIEVYDLLLKYKYNIVKAMPVYVDHCLLGVRGAKLKDIKKVYTHPHAFPQCADFLSKHHNFEQIPYVNTAMAAEMVAQEGDKSKAAIASVECAHLYGLDILSKSIQQDEKNCTRFISVSKKLEITEDANKISLILTLPHITGSLYRILARFALNGLNLTKIESRPYQQKNFEYFFYIDFTGSVRSPSTLKLLSMLSEELPVFYFLGNYNETN
jgi:chorismate mutase/prephenate dehydratase